MQIINQFIFNTLIFLILIINLSVILLGSLFLLKTILEEGLEIDFNDIVKIRRSNDEDSSIRSRSSKDS